MANIDRLEEFQTHIQTLVSTPETAMDTKLFDDIELQITRKLHLMVYTRGQIQIQIIATIIAQEDMFFETVFS